MLATKQGQMAFSGLAFVNLFILTCVYPHQSFFYGIVYGGGGGEEGGRGRGGEEGRRGRRGKEGVGCVFVIKPLKQVS